MNITKEKIKEWLISKKPDMVGIQYENKFHALDDTVNDIYECFNDLAPKLENISNIEEIPIKGTEILCFDGCDYSIDYVDTSSDDGTLFMANGTEVESWMPLPEAPK